LHFTASPWLTWSVFCHHLFTLPHLVCILLKLFTLPHLGCFVFGIFWIWDVL
jgi:hypothetical protein